MGDLKLNVKLDVLSVKGTLDLQQLGMTTEITQTWVFLQSCH